MAEAQRKGTRSMQRKFRLLREEAYREGLETFEELVADPTFRDFVCLYIAEGSKRNRNRVAICNSDAVMMRMATLWLRRLRVKTPEFWLQYHADQDPDDLRGFWAQTLGIEADAINLQRKSNSNQLTGRCWRSRHGVIIGCVHDTLLRTRLQAWMDVLRDEWR